MFRALTCPSSGGKIVFTQHLVSLLSVNVCTLTNILLMNKENCALKLVDEIILYYDAWSKKHQNTGYTWRFAWMQSCFCYLVSVCYREVLGGTCSKETGFNKLVSCGVK